MSFEFAFNQLKNQIQEVNEKNVKIHVTDTHPE